MFTITRIVNEHVCLFVSFYFLFSTVGVTAGQWPLFVLLKEDSRCERFLFLLHLSPPGDLCRCGVLGLGAVNTLLVNMVLNVHRNRKAYQGRGEGGRGRLPPLKTRSVFSVLWEHQQRRLSDPSDLPLTKYC